MAKKSGTVGAQHETTIVLTPKTVLEELAKAKHDTKTRTQSMNGTLGKKIAAAVESKHLDRKAFSMASQLASMDDERLHVTYHCLLHYMDALGVERRATAQEEMFANGGDDEDGEEAAARKKGRKSGDIVSIGKAARAVAEKAGDEFKSTH